MQKRIGTCVLDYDGVVLKNKHIQHKISDLSNAHMARYLNISKQNAEDLSKTFLPKFGHTSKICNYIDNSYNEKECLNNYHNDVFSLHNIERLCFYLDDSDIDHINNLYELKLIHDYKFVLFSNAPDVWTKCLFQYTNVKYEEFYDEIFNADNNILKPDICSYINVEKSCPEEKLFIDDNTSNFIHDDKWTCMYHGIEDDNLHLYKILYTY